MEKINTDYKWRTWKIWINISRYTNCEVALLRPFIPLALHNCILPYQVSSAIIARVVLKLVSWLVEQHVAIPVAMTSFRVTVDCKTTVYWKSTAKPLNKHSEFCSTSAKLINVVHVKFYERNSNNTIQFFFTWNLTRKCGYQLSNRITSNHTVSVLTAYVTIVITRYYTTVAQPLTADSHFTVDFKRKI